MVLSDRVTRADVLAALADMERGISQGKAFREGTEYFTPYNGRQYPPKEVIRHAHKLKDLDTGEFHGGKPTEKFLTSRGIPMLKKHSLDDAVGILRGILNNLPKYPEVQGLISSKDEVIKIYGPVFSKYNYASLTAEGLLPLRVPDGAASWTLIMQKGDYARDIPYTKRCLEILYDDKLDIVERLNSIYQITNDTRVRLSDAKITALLALHDPKSYGIWDKFSKDALDESDLYPKITGNQSGGNQYWAYNEVFKCLTKELGVDMWTLDALFRGVGPLEASRPTSLSGSSSKSNNIDLLVKKRQAILFGPPGTGKTHQTRDLSKGVINLTSGKNETYEDLRGTGRIGFITFHPSYSYEEFIEGITIDVQSTLAQQDGRPRYILRNGVFKTMAMNALAAALEVKVDEKTTIPSLLKLYNEKVRDLDERSFWAKAPRFVLIIDEINRGDISKIFGELITLMEDDKRLGGEHALRVTLPYSQEEFAVPSNLYVIGTMNTADKSIALLDVALRRRFGFIEMAPDFDALEIAHLDAKISELQANGVYDYLVDSSKALEAINEAISKEPTLGRDKSIGHAFLFKVMTVEDLIMVWNNEIVPLLEEYCYGTYSTINRLLFNGRDEGWFDQATGFEKIESEVDLKEFLGSVVGSKQ